VGLLIAAVIVLLVVAIVAVPRLDGLRRAWKTRNENEPDNNPLRRS
jgi:hypothetical protein